MVQTATAANAAPENPTAIFDTAIADAERLLQLLDKLTVVQRKDKAHILSKSIQRLKLNNQSTSSQKIIEGQK